MLIYCALAAPVIAAAVYAGFGWTLGTRWVGTLAGLWAAYAGLKASDTFGVDEAFSGWLRIDDPASNLLFVIGVVTALAMAGFPAQIANDFKDHVIGPVTARWYGVFAMLVLAAAVAAAASTSELAGLAATGIMIVAMAGLIASRRRPAQLRAAIVYTAWCGGGLVVAFLGTRYSQEVPADTVTLLGFAALAGLAPLHWWLPSTVTIATAPVSVLITGVQVPVALTAILRLEAAPRIVLIGFALATVAAAAAGVVRQHDLRRLVAHIGLTAAGLSVLALGTTAYGVGQLLLLWLGLNAAALYLAAGHVVSLTGSGRIATVRGLLSRNQLLAAVLGAGLFASAVLVPVFGLGRILAAGDGPPLAVTAALAVASVVVAAFTAPHAVRILTGDPADRPDLTIGPPRPLGSAGPVLLVAATAAVLAPLILSASVARPL